MSGLLLRRQAMIGVQKNAELPVWNPSVELTLDKILTQNQPTIGEDHAGGAITDYLPCSVNNVIVYKNAVAPASIATSTGVLGRIIVYNSQKSSVDWWNCRANGSEGSFTAERFQGNGYVRLNIVMDGMADSYAYNRTTGVVYYAGRNTPYYGKTNIND